MSALPLSLVTELSYDIQIDMMYARPDNFTGHVIYQHSLCFLHPLAAQCLRQAAMAARGFGLQLLVLDAYRPHEAQEALWAVFPKPGYVADPAKGSNHTRGVAVDLTLLASDGKPLDMGTEVDTMTPASHHFYAGFSSAVLVNRMRLLTIMLESGFVHHPNEWWHYQLPQPTRFPLIDSPTFMRCVAEAQALQTPAG